MDRELKRGTLEMLLLHLLAREQRYGYELVDLVGERSGGAFTVTGGTLYPVLYRLEEDGYVATRWETRERGNPRKYYRVTAKGEQELARRTQEWRSFREAVDRVLRPEEEVDR